MRRRILLTLAALGSLTLGGCEGCLNLDEYTLVQGQGGGGSDAGTTYPCQSAVEGSILVVLPPAPAASPDTGSGPCALPGNTGPGIDVFALAPWRNTCVARMRITQAEGATLTGPMHARYTAGSRAVVAGTFRGGALSLPLRCDQSATVTLDAEVGATDTLFVAQLRLDGTRFCTDWARRASTQEPGAAGALRVNTVDVDGEDHVAIAGTLGGALTQFENPTSSLIEVRGHAFFARYSAGGALEAVNALPGTPGASDAALDLGESQGSWFATGALRAETPACHGCPGSTAVVDAAGVCPAGEGAGGAGGAGAGGAGGAGGMTGAGGAGGTPGTGGAGGVAGAGGAPLDGDNALLWSPGATGSCNQLTTVGSDRLGDLDAQRGLSLSMTTGTGTCTAYWSGLAGRQNWLFNANDASTSLYSAVGLAQDGFIARLDGDGVSGCGTTSGAAWNLRLVPSTPGAVAMGARVEALRCGTGATAAVLALGETSAVDVHRCTTRGACEASLTRLILLPDTAEQLAVMGLRGDGTPEWQASLGPIATDPSGHALAQIAHDGRDGIHVLLTTTGPLRLQNLELTFCDQIQPGADAGTYLFQLTRAGSLTAGARCLWATRLAP